MNFNKVQNERKTKHSASKKGFQHNHNLSKGQTKSAEYAEMLEIIRNDADKEYDNDFMARFYENIEESEE